VRTHASSYDFVFEVVPISLSRLKFGGGGVKFVAANRTRAKDRSEVSSESVDLAKIPI
jgi:hypothetical protein